MSTEHYHIERFSIECRRTKTEVITPTNQLGNRQSNEPIKTCSKLDICSGHKVRENVCERVLLQLVLV